jgi:internalin A
VRGLEVQVSDALDFSPIRHLHELRTLELGETKRRSLSLAFLRETPLIETLSIDGTGGRDFDAIAELRHLRMLKLRAPRTKTLEALREHPSLEGVTITLGGIRDLTPLATIPNLRALFLWGIRLLDTDDFAAIGNCANLGGLSIGALPHVRDLAALARGPADTLRFLMLDGMKGLATLRHLGDCKRLKELFMVDPAQRIDSSTPWSAHPS